MIVSLGPTYGYYPNSSKTWVLVMEEDFSKEIGIFEGSNVQIIDKGRQYLESLFRCSIFIQDFVKYKVTSWVQEIKYLTAIAMMYLRAAFENSHTWFLQSINYCYLYHS